MENILGFEDTTRREILRKAVFVTPLILTLPVIPSFARAGSGGADDVGGTGGGDGGGGRSASNSGRRRRRCNFWCRVFDW